MPVTYVTGDVAGTVESPVYAILQMNRALSTIQTARRIRPRDLQHAAAVRQLEVRHEVGRRVAHHLRGVPRPRDRVRRGAHPHLHPRRGLVPVVRDATHDHAGDSVLAGRHPARARFARRVLHGDIDDRLHRGRGHRRPQLDHPRGFHRVARQGRHVARGRGGRCRRGAVPADGADRRGRDRRVRQ